MSSNKHKKITKEKQKPEKRVKKDERFRNASYDPKFAPVPQNISKVKIDKRFKKMLTDPKFKISTSTDKYGKKQQDEKQNKQLMEYYYMDENESIEEEESQNQNKISKWMEEYDEESSGQEEIEMDDLINQSENSLWSEEKVRKDENVEATKRLALCNFDWMNISAKDLMLLFSSFKPSTGNIVKIVVYYSNYGAEKLKNEEMYGPSGIWQENEQKQQEKQKQKTKWNVLVQDKEQEEANFNEVKLRTYEKDRLKYCFALIECDSIQTADSIYRECDGNQFQSSNLEFDLRFMPDELQLNDQNIKDTCSDLPLNGEVKNFVNRATGHSKVSLSWEDPELNTIASLKKKNWNKMTTQELGNVDWGKYLDDGEIENENYEGLALQNEEEVEKKQSYGWRDEFNKKKNRQDNLEITFGSGFGGEKQEQKQKVSLKKQMKSRKQRWQEKKRRKNEANNSQKLGLLVEKEKEKKESFKYNAEDPRFPAVFNNPAYAIDPVNPQFDHRKSGQVFRQVVKRNKNKHSS